jgi:hypothetical protein
MQDEIDLYLSQTLADLGANNADIEGVYQMAADRWLLAFSGDRQMDIQLDELGNRLVFTMEIGQPQSKDRARVMAALLTYNHMWPETGSLRTAMLGEDGPASLIGDLYLPELDDARLQRHILGILELSGPWHEFVVGQMDRNPAASAEMLMRV